MFSDFIKRYKAVSIIICAALAVLAGVTCGFMVLNATKKAAQTGAEVSSGLVSSSESLPESQETQPPVDNGIRLVITSPENPQVSTTEAFIKIAGTSDSAEPLTMNGSIFERNSDGSFSKDVNLAVGKNTFTFAHKGEEKVITVSYRYVVINGYFPSSAQAYSSGSTFAVTVAARSGSKVSAVFDGSTITLTENPKTSWQDASGSAFNNFTGSFQLPVSNIDRNLGKIKYTATYNGVTESFYSGNITCRRSEIITDYDPSTPLAGRYIQVGAGYIAEIIGFTAETFDGNTVDDTSRPTNNYLPQGTVDYCSVGDTYVTESKGVKRYTTLRCGRRVYIEKKDDVGGQVRAVTSQYLGALPDHNEVSIASVNQSGRHTVIALDVMWKAPFYFDLLQQNYTNPAKQDYTISAATYKYIDITFCYTTVFTGEVAIDPQNPLFSSAEVIPNQYDTTLRLHLKKMGSFYGWDCSYNESGQLVFEFLHPIKLSSPGSLAGTKIMIDVGHGGIDPGAVGAGNAYESSANLNLALKLKGELEALGASVVMSRTDNNTTLVSDQRVQRLKSEKPDYCIAIHHDSAASATAGGFSSFYSTPFSMNASRFVLERAQRGGIYGKYKLGWHYFYLARSTVCPVVLTENGYMSNAQDLQNILNDGINTLKAQEIAQGVVDYFNSI